MKRTILAVLLVGLVIGTAACQTGELGGPSQTGRQNIRGIAIDYAGSNAALDVDQRGTGNEIMVRDSQTPVAYIADGGAMSLTSPKNQHKLLVKAASTQSTPPVLIQNSSGTVVASIDNAGGVAASSVTNSGAMDITGHLMVGATPAATPVAGAASIAGAVSVGSLTDAGAADIVGRLMVGATPASTPVAGAANIAGALGVGGSTTFNAADLNGTKLTVDADADSWLDESADDIIDLALGAAAGYWNILTGNLKVGDGTPSVTMDGEDAYIEGAFEVDGAALFDSTADLNGHQLLLDPLQTSNISAATNGMVNVTVPATGTVGISAGNFAVGSGTSDQTENGEDAYVTGMFEVDGATRLDGAVDLNGAVDLDGVVTNAVNLEHLFWPTIASASVISPTSTALWTIGANETWIVHDLFCNVTTNFDCTGNDCTVQIGDGNDTDGFLTLADAELQAADAEGTGFAAGWQGLVAATVGAYLDPENVFVYNTAGAPETIDVAFGGTAMSAGEATCYIMYTRIR